MYKCRNCLPFFLGLACFLLPPPLLLLLLLAISALAAGRTDAGAAFLDGDDGDRCFGIEAAAAGATNGDADAADAAMAGDGDTVDAIVVVSRRTEGRRKGLLWVGFHSVLAVRFGVHC